MSIDDSKAYSGFAVPDLEAAREFYGETLGVEVSELDGAPLLQLELDGGERADAHLPEARPRAGELHDPELPGRRRRGRRGRADGKASSSSTTTTSTRTRRASPAPSGRPDDRLVQGPGGQHPLRARGRLGAGGRERSYSGSVTAKTTVRLKRVPSNWTP